MYYLWLYEKQAGPFPLEQLQSMWNTGQVTAVTLYWEEGNADWLPLNNLASLLQTGLSIRVPVLPPAIPAGPVKAPMSPRPVSPLVASAEETIWTGHPTLWCWTGSFILGVILIPVVIGVFVLGYIFLLRNSTIYTITNRRVSLERGIFAKSSRELRIEDIRSIAARANVFGIGDAEFSTAARAEAEVIFEGISQAARIRNLVKRLQNDVR